MKKYVKSSLNVAKQRMGNKMPQRTPFTLSVNSTEIKGELYQSASEKSPNPPALIICHGIPAGDNPCYTPGSSSGYELLAGIFSEMGYNTIIFNFSGTGKSGGNLDLSEWVKQLKEVIKYYRDKAIENIEDQKKDAFSSVQEPLQKDNKISLHLLGFSAGAAVSVMAAAEIQQESTKKNSSEKEDYPLEIESVALCAPPGNFRFLIDKLTENGVWEWFKGAGFFTSPETLPPKAKWFQNFLSVEPEKYINKIKTGKLLIIHGEKDDLVPPEHATNLYNMATGNKKLIIHPDEGHQLRHSEKVIKNLREWFKGHLAH